MGLFGVVLLVLLVQSPAKCQHHVIVASDAWHPGTITEYSVRMAGIHNLQYLSLGLVPVACRKLIIVSIGGTPKHFIKAGRGIRYKVSND